MVVTALIFLAFGSVAPAHASQPANRTGRGAPAAAVTVLYSQPFIPAGNWYQSSANGTDYDKFVWDNFTLPAGQVSTITEVRWRGAYVPNTPSSGVDFTVAIYPSVPGVFQPDMISGPLVTYPTHGSAGETEAGASGSLAMTYEYSFTLPQPFQASAGTRYWIYIVATQAGIPNWYVLQGSGGEGWHYLRQAGAGDWLYSKAPGDVAFTLVGSATLLPKTYLPLMLR